MAIELSGSGQYFTSASGTVISAYPFSMAVRINPDVVNTNQTVLQIAKSTSSNNWIRFLLFNNGELWCQGNRNDDSGGGGTSVQVDTPTVTANVWSTAIVTAASSAVSADWGVWLNGNGAGTWGGDFVFPTGIDEVNIGHNNGSELLNGSLAEAAIWNIELTAAERAIYDAGVSPLKIRPQSLVFYCPGVRSVIDVIGGKTLTATGSPTTDTHGLIYNPLAQTLQFPPQAAAGRIMSSLTHHGGLAGHGGIAGIGGGLAG